MPNKLYFIIIGQALSGIFVAFLIIPVLPEMMAAANEKYGNRQKQRVNTLSSGLFNASLGLGQTLGPIIGGALYEWVSFRPT